jgi:hypothetical protein
MTKVPLPLEPGFNPRTPLVRAAHISLEVEASGRVRALRPEGGYRVIPRGLEILSRFGTPASAKDVLEGLNLQGAHDWIAAYEAIRRLHADGLLHEPGKPSGAAAVLGFEGTPVHALMLNDRARTEGFIRAIETVVREGDVVVDIGTGTGILAMAAARAGARHVFAIEHSSMADTAAAVFKANGFDDRITVMRGTSFAVTLPEPADVIVTEMLGHHALDEGLLGLIADARARHARPQARVIPRGLTVMAMAVEIPQDDLALRALSARALEAWREWYGFNLSPVADRAGRSSFLIRSEEAASWPALTPAVAAFQVDLEGPRIPEVVTASAEVVASRTGEANGLALGMRVDLAEDVVIETLPGRATPGNHWKCPIWLSPHSFAVVEGESLKINYSHGEPQHARGEFAEILRNVEPASQTSGDPGEAAARPSPAPPLSQASVVLRSPAHLAATFGDEIAVAPATADTPFILESTGAAIWARLGTPIRVDAICESLAEEFDIQSKECEPDVMEFLQDLIRKGLVAIVS